MRKVDTEPALEAIINSFDRFVYDFFEWVIAQDPQDSNLEQRIHKENSPLGKVARRTSVKKILISFVRCPERNLVYFSYLNYIRNYKNMMDGIPFLKIKFSKETLELIENAFLYFYETLIEKKTFQQYYIPDYDGPDQLKREIRKRFGLERVCPYCDFHSISHEDYSSIDHFLPKSKFPLLSIHSKNLVVSCSGCNDRIKLDKYNLPIIHPLFDDVTQYIKFKFDQNIDNIDVEFIGQYAIEVKSAFAFFELFKLKDVYTTVLYRLKADRKKIRNNVESKWLMIEKSQRDFYLLKTILNDEYSIFKNENFKKRGYFGLTKLRIDFCEFLQDKGKDADLEYLAEKLSIEIGEQVLN